jgi:hypothetical protein
MEVTKGIWISKYIHLSLPCVIRSQTCLVRIVLLLDIMPRAFSTCKILKYIVLRQVNPASEWVNEANYLIALGYVGGEVLNLFNHAFFTVKWTADLNFLIANVQWLSLQSVKFRILYSKYTFITHILDVSVFIHISADSYALILMQSVDLISYCKRML